MQGDKILQGKMPDEFNAIIEIPMNDNPVKYELDKESGAIFVDRFMQISMSYPCNYGFIPNTLSGDGDPVDVLVLSNYPIIPSAVIKCRPIGVLMMEDESGLDKKIIAVPVSKVDISFDNIRNITDVSGIIKERIKHFFEHYKDLDKDKWVKVLGWGDIEVAKKLIEEGVTRNLAN
jgi:inorganic pyrophosphatase